MNVARAGRYLGVSAACAVLYNAVMIGGDRLGAPYPASLAVSFVLVACAGYALHVGVTWRALASWGGFGRYAAAAAAGLPVSFALLFVLHDVLRLDMLFAAPVTTALTFAVNLFAVRWAILRAITSPLTGTRP